MDPLVAPPPLEFATDDVVLLTNTPVERGVPRAGDAMGELRRLSGLSWDELARLFGIGRGVLHAWASGAEMESDLELRLGSVLETLKRIDRGSSGDNRSLLFSPGPDGRLPFDHLAAGECEQVVSLVGAGEERGVRPEARVSDEVRRARTPPPPHELVGALQDRVHPASGRLLSVTPIRPRRK